MWPTFYIPRRRGRYPVPVVVRTVYTTPPYPIEVIEAVASGYPQISASFGGFGYGTDLFLSSYSVLAGEIRDILQAFTAPPEAFISSYSLLSGELRQILRDFTAPPEIFQSGYSVISGAIQRILISYDHLDPDSFKSSYSVVSGTLT